MSEDLAREKAVKKLVLELFAGYRAEEATPERMNVYFQDFKTLPLDILEVVVPDLRRASRRLPSTADVVEEVRKRRNKQFQDRESEERERQRTKTSLSEASTDVQKYFFAISHNVDARKKKEAPLLKARKLAETEGDLAKVEEIRNQIAQIRVDHQIIADQIRYEFQNHRAISYLKEIQAIPFPPSGSKEKDFQSIGGITPNQIIQGARSDKGASL